MGNVSHSFGIIFQWKQYNNGNLHVYFIQEAYVDHLISYYGLFQSSIVDIPYISGHMVDSISSNIFHLTKDSWYTSDATISRMTTVPFISNKIEPQRYHITPGATLIKPSFWTPDGSQIWNSVYQGIKSQGHLLFKKKSHVPWSHTLFSIGHNKIFPLSDASWSPQDQPAPDPIHPKQIPPCMVRSISEFIIFHNESITWVANIQKDIVRSSKEAEIYATDECVKKYCASTIL